MDRQPWGSGEYGSPDGNRNPWGGRGGYENPGDGSGGQPQNRSANGMALTALIFGMLGLISCLFIVPSLLFGPLSILFAHLSKGNEKKSIRPARIGAILGGIGFAISAAMMIFSMAWIFSVYGGVGPMREKFEKRIEEYSKEDEDPEEIYQRIYQDIYEDLYGSEAPSQGTAGTGEMTI